MANFKTNARQRVATTDLNPTNPRSVSRILKEAQIRSYSKFQPTHHFRYYIAILNITTMELAELEKELSHIKWDILGLCDTRSPEQQTITLKSGYIIDLNNKASDAHLTGTASLLNRRIID